MPTPLYGPLDTLATQVSLFACKPLIGNAPGVTQTCHCSSTACRKSHTHRGRLHPHGETEPLCPGLCLRGSRLTLSAARRSCGVSSRLSRFLPRAVPTSPTPPFLKEPSCCIYLQEASWGPTALLKLRLLVPGWHLKEPRPFPRVVVSQFLARLPPSRPSAPGQRMIHPAAALGQAPGAHGPHKHCLSSFHIPLHFSWKLPPHASISPLSTPGRSTSLVPQLCPSVFSLQSQCRCQEGS